MRTGDPRRWRLGGRRRRGKQREGWWKGSDGRWYPPAAARHPAARDEPAAPGRTPPRRLAFAGPLWLVALVPVAVLAAVVLDDVTDTTPTARVETFGADGPGSPGKTSQDRPDAGSASAPASPSVDGESVEAAVPSGGGSPTRTGDPGDLADPGDPVDPADPGDGGDEAGTDASPAGSASPAPPEVAAPPSPTTVAPPATPRSRDDCRHGGWQRLVDDQGRPFANQGRCVGYVNGGG